MYDKSLNVPDEKCIGKLDLSYINTKKRVKWDKTNGFKTMVLKHSN